MKHELEAALTRMIEACTGKRPSFVGPDLTTALHLCGRRFGSPVDEVVWVRTFIEWSWDMEDEDREKALQRLDDPESCSDDTLAAAMARTLAICERYRSQ
mgnify:FL=1